MKRTLLILACAMLVAGCGGSGPRPFLSGGAYRHGVCYGPHRDGQRPGGAEPSAAQIAEDLGIIARHWGLVRTYGASGPTPETILRTIREQGLDLKVMLGVWIAPPSEPDAARENAAEIAAGIRLANAYPDVVAAVAVGNETQVHWSAHRSPVAGVIAAVREVRAAVAQPVTSADDFNYWNKPESRELAAELDFIAMHAHPLWNGKQLDEGLAWVREQIAAVAELHPDRPIVLAETGWATSVADHGEQAELIKGAPGEAEQKVFMDAVRAWSKAAGRTVMWFEVFDENWKGGDDPAEVEKHWGVYRADRTPKAWAAGAAAR